jgi:hypothetical protein
VSTRKILPLPKYENEEIGQSVDFVDRLEAGETITGRNVTAMHAETLADETSNLISVVGGSGTEISFLVSSGTAGVTYWIDVAATLNTAEVLVQRMRLDMQEP